MLMRFVLVATMAAVLAANPGHAAVLCARKSGTVVMRATACKGKRETLIDPLALRGPQGAPAGPAFAGYVEIPDFGGNVTVLDVPGFGRVTVESGGCSTQVTIQAIAVGYVNTTGTDQDVLTFSFNPLTAPDAVSGYAVGLPGAETGLRQIGSTGAIFVRIRPQGGTAEATITIFGAAGGSAGDVCRVSAQALVTAGS